MTVRLTASTRHHSTTAREREVDIDTFDSSVLVVSVDSEVDGGAINDGAINDGEKVDVSVT